MKTAHPGFFRPLFAFLSLSIVLASPTFAQEDELLKHPRDMKFLPLSFRPAKPVRTVLSNGMVVFLLENAELPLIRLSALIRSGSIYEPADKKGLAKLTAKVLRTGGARGRSSRSINEDLEWLAADIEFSMARESGSASLFARKADFPRVLAIFADLLKNPAFDPAQVDLAKKQEIEAIRRSNDNPEEVAFREFRRFLYSDNPRGWSPTIETVERIQREDLIAFHRKFFQPHNILLGISGDFHQSEMVSQLEAAFRDWGSSLLEFPLIPLPVPADQKRIYSVPKNLPQSTIVLGHLSIPANHPDHFPLIVLNFILGGGGFNSRLMREIRSNRGLAYAVGSFYHGRVGYGVLGAYCQTKSSSTHQAIALLYEMIDGLRKNGVTPEELQWAKNSLIHQFIFSFASSADIVNQRMRLEYDGLPEAYLDNYQERMAAVTREDLERVAQKHLHPDQAVLVVVGKEENFDQPLSSFGPVQRVPLRDYP
jgi:zinc protease